MKHLYKMVAADRSYTKKNKCKRNWWINIFLAMIFLIRPSLAFASNTCVSLSYPNLWGSSLDYNNRLPATPSSDSDQYEQELIYWLEESNIEISLHDAQMLHFFRHQLFIHKMVKHIIY